LVVSGAALGYAAAASASPAGWRLLAIALGLVVGALAVDALTSVLSVTATTIRYRSVFRRWTAELDALKRVDGGSGSGSAQGSVKLQLGRRTLRLPIADFSQPALVAAMLLQVIPSASLSEGGKAELERLSAK